MQTRYSVIKPGEEPVIVSSLKTEKLAVDLLKTLEIECFIEKQELVPADFPHSKWAANEVYGRKYLKDFKFTIEDFDNTWEELKNKHLLEPGFVVLFGIKEQEEEWMKGFDDAIREFAENYGK